MIRGATSCRNSFGRAARDPKVDLGNAFSTPPSSSENPFPSRASILNSSPGRVPVTILGIIWDWEQRTGKGKRQTFANSISRKNTATNWRLWKNSLWRLRCPKILRRHSCGPVHRHQTRDAKAPSSCKPTAEEREKIDGAITDDDRIEATQHIYFYHGMRPDRGTAVYQGAHHRASNGIPKSSQRNTIREIGFKFVFPGAYCLTFPAFQKLYMLSD